MGGPFYDQLQVLIERGMEVEGQIKYLVTLSDGRSIKALLGELNLGVASLEDGPDLLLWHQSLKMEGEGTREGEKLQT